MRAFDTFYSGTRYGGERGQVTVMRNGQYPVNREPRASIDWAWGGEDAVRCSKALLIDFLEDEQLGEMLAVDFYELFLMFREPAGFRITGHDMWLCIRKAASRHGIRLLVKVEMEHVEGKQAENNNRELP